MVLSLVIDHSDIRFSADFWWYVMTPIYTIWAIGGAAIIIGGYRILYIDSEEDL